MIIAVSIGKSLAEDKSVLDATKRAWDLNINNCKKHQFVIGVANSKIHGCFYLKNVFPDSLEPKRVAFELQECSEADETYIRNYISTNNINLKGIQKGKYI